MHDSCVLDDACALTGSSFLCDIHIANLLTDNG